MVASYKTIHHVLPAFGRIPDDVADGPRSGLVQAALRFGHELASSGREVTIDGWAPGKSRSMTTPQGVMIHTHPGFKFGRIGPYDVRWLAPMALRSLRQSNPDVLHAHSDPNLLRLRARAKVLHLQVPTPTAFPPAYTRLLRFADVVVCCSHFIRSQFLSTSGWHEDRTVVVPNGTDIDRFHPASAEERRAARAKLGLPQDAILALHAGAVVPEKGVIHLVRAFRAVSAAVPAAHFVIAGGNLWSGLGDGSNALSDYTRQVMAEVGPNMHFLGARPHKEMPTLYMAADLFTIASVWDEPFPLAALDALAAGLPIIASRVGGLPEIVVSERVGLLVPPADEEALARAIIRLASDESLRHRYGAAGRERSVRFAWRNVSQELEAAYEQAMLHSINYASLEARSGQL